MFQVTLNNNGATFYLRGTTWAFVPERGNTFESVEQANAAIERAKKFLARKTLGKNIRIVEASL